MIVLDGPAGNGIGANVAKRLDAAYALVNHKVFPDGESYIRIPSLEEDDTVAVVQSTYAPHEKHLIELLFMIDALKEMGTKHIVAVVPYLAYVRQNRMFTANEAVSINTVMRLLSESGAEALVTVEPHRYDVVSLFEGKFEIVDPSAAFAEELGKRVKTPFVVATDGGDMVRAKKMAELLDCEYDFIEKERDLATNKVRAVSSLTADLKGKEVVIFDDVISTGGTIELAAKMAVSNGAKKVIAAAAHLVMANNAYERITGAGVSEIYGTNTIPFPRAHLIDVSAQIADAMKKIVK
jgi:ribose-phosphate pyrophosphokinase